VGRYPFQVGTQGEGYLSDEHGQRQDEYKMRLGGQIEQLSYLQGRRGLVTLIGWIRENESETSDRTLKRLGYLSVGRVTILSQNSSMHRTAL
jgi:hypothetical protein